MDDKIEQEYYRIKAGPQSGLFTFLHHEGPVTEYSSNVMERVGYILTEKPETEHYDRLRHIYAIDLTQMPAVYQQSDKVWQEADKVRQEAYKVYQQSDKVWQEADKVRQEAFAPYILTLIPNCAWDGKTILHV